jgi:hypothetical protein
VNPHGPVAIIVPGFQSRGKDHKDLTEMTRMMVAANISVLAFDYSGRDPNPKKPDPATFDTHVTDTKSIIGTLGDRPHILVSQSFGINVALKSANDKTQKIVAAIPAPWLYERNILGMIAQRPWYERAAFHAVMHTTGFYCWTNKRGEQVKITSHFTDSVRTNPVEQIIASKNTPRIAMTIVANRRDFIFPETDKHKLTLLLTSSNFSSVQTIIAQAAGHHIHPITAQTVVDAIKAPAITL